MRSFSKTRTICAFLAASLTASLAQAQSPAAGPAPKPAPQESPATNPDGSKAATPSGTDVIAPVPSGAAGSVAPAADESTVGPTAESAEAAATPADVAAADSTTGTAPVPGTDNPPPAPGSASSTTEAAAPTTLAIGKEGNGFFQPGALLQFWTVYTHQEDLSATSDHAFTFRLRRAELKAKGEIMPKQVSYQLMFDLAKAAPRFETTTVEVTDPNADPAADPATVDVVRPAGSDQSILQDFFITFHSDYADVSLGQFKNPVGLESLQSSSKLLLPERAAAVREYGDRRELGLRVEKKLGEHFYYQAALFNGNGINTIDVDNDKSGGLRLEVYPVKALTLAAVGYATLGSRENALRDRLEGDVRFESNGFLAQAEYIRAWNRDAAATVSGHGGYAAFGYTVAAFQPILRVGLLDRNLDAEDDSALIYEAGLNYFLQSHEAKFVLGAAFTDPEASDAPLRSEVTLAAQVSF